jgi:hypothetical protein
MLLLSEEVKLGWISYTVLTEIKRIGVTAVHSLPEIVSIILTPAAKTFTQTFRLVL